MADKTIIQISGLTGPQISPVAGKIIGEKNSPTIVITSSFERALSISNSLSFFTDKKIFTVPEDDPFFFHFEAKSRDELNLRLEAILSLKNADSVSKKRENSFENNEPILIVPISGALKKTLPPEVFFAYAFKLEEKKEVDIDILKKSLSFMGYERVSTVESKGEFSVRGGIVDFFSPNFDNPVRVDFFGDEIETLRYFDSETQISITNISSVDVFPASEIILDDNLIELASSGISDAYNREIAEGDSKFIETLRSRKDELLELINTGQNRQLLEKYVDYFTDEPSFITDYLPENGIVIVDDPDRVFETASLREKEAMADFLELRKSGNVCADDINCMSRTEDIGSLFNTHDSYYFTSFEKKPESTKITGSFPSEIKKVISFSAKHPPIMGGNIKMLVSEIKRYIKNSFEITLVCSTKERLNSLNELVDAEGLTGKVSISLGKLESGIELTSEKKVWIWDGDVFHSGKKRKRIRSKKDNAQIRSFSDINKGDYIVHENHGVAKYLGIEQKVIQGFKKDYLKLKYAGNDFLYVPIEQMSSVQKYIGGGEARPKINRLSGNEWQNTKARVKADIAEMAADLVAVSAERKSRPGYAFSKDTAWQKEFEDKFPFEETDDQLKSIASIKADMEKPLAMDRLLCGDVGYGKTEVALRAVFKCVADEKQAVILVPTTILASQHFATFTERFSDTPFRIEVLSRFKTRTEQKNIIKDIEKGLVDVVIGTHRLLSNDIKYKDLGLLVVDEEQRFGVKHKEKIKALKSNIDVLTMSATPIPRTLNMSLMGLRDMDLIEEPPEDRYPVQTYVMEESESIIHETIIRELDRGGQVYVVSPRISSIDKITSSIRSLIPEASIAVGHGRMNEQELENVMLEFIKGDYDILISTTIIESGIDIPNVNTILIFDSDKFGLSQLYQLRGRVGRSNRVAFSYLLYKQNKQLSEVAEKRLQAIKEFTEFGAGFKIAMRDLEIRGAGNILGAQQHGHIVSIGYELYCKMVEEAVNALKGVSHTENEEEVSIAISIPAFIPNHYIDDEVLKLQVYRKISFIDNIAEMKELLEELTDRFGIVPGSVKNLIYVSIIKHLANKLGIKRVYEDDMEMVLVWGESDSLTPSSLSSLIDEFGSRITIRGTVIPSVRFSVAGGTERMLDLIKLLTILKH